MSSPVKVAPPTIKAPSAKLPQISDDMTLPQFRKFVIDWNVFKQITGVTGSQTLAQLYSCCEDTVQNSIVNTIPDIFAVSEKQLLKDIESIVTKRSNPSVHRMTFASLNQISDESIQEYLVKLRSSAPDCEFTCPNCKFDLSPVHIKDQFIRGLYTESLQTDILAKASQLKTLEEIIKHAEAYEAATRDQQKLQTSSEVMGMRSSQYKKKMNKQTNKYTNKRPCPGCGSYEHGQRNANDRPNLCPA